MDIMEMSAFRNYFPKTKEIKFCLFSEARWIRLLSGLGKPYEHIIEGLIKVADYWYSDICQIKERELTIKWIAEKLNETPQNINKWLPRIYKDLFELNDSKPELFASEGEILCCFLLSGFEYDRTCTFSFGLPTIPHRGDTLNFKFVSAALDCDSFYINDIRFSRFYGETNMFIHCNPKEHFRSTNHYREFLLEKARFMNQIDYKTESEANLYLDEMLQFYEKNGYVPSIETIKQEREELYKLWRESRKK